MSLFNELKRRSVFRVGIAYVIIAWLVAQILQLVFESFGTPEWVMKTVLVLMAAGMPFVLFFAWAFELTPEGLKREHEVDRSQSITNKTSRKLDFFIISVLAVAMVYLGVDKLFLTQELSTALPVAESTSTEIADTRKSIAVIPFANRSDKKEDVFFVDGIHDDVLTQLARIRSLKVISRTSMMQYRDTTKNMPQIGEELGVRNILEGGVQRAGDRVRINVQLIDAQADEHLWAETYERELTAENIFSIQSEIATAIAKALAATLSPDEQQRLSSVPTQNLEALESYFHGKRLSISRLSNELIEAVDYFERAVDLDPEFALAYVGLADAWVLRDINDGQVPSAEAQANAKAAIDNALRLDPGLGEAYASLGLLRWAQNNYEDALESLVRATNLNPNYAPAIQWQSGVLGVLGRATEALPLAEKALELDPLAPIIHFALGQLFATLGRVDEALAACRRSVEINPEFVRGMQCLGDLYAQVLNRRDEGLKWFEKAAKADPKQPYNPAAIAFIFLDLGDQERAAIYVQKAAVLNNDFPGVIYYLNQDNEPALLEVASKSLTQYPSSLVLHVLGERDVNAGDPAAAVARYKQYYPKLFDDEPRVDGNNFSPAVDIFPFLVAAGDQECADLLLEKSLAFLATQKRSSLYLGFFWNDAKALLYLGRRADAMTVIQETMDAGTVSAWRNFFDYDPVTEPLRDDLEFIALRKRLESDMAQQLARVNANKAEQASE